MPEMHRGVAVAYCDAPGPLEEASVPTYVAVSPTPATWDDEQVASFYREYNATLLHDLTIHESMPGHVLQLAHAARAQTPTRVRRFGFSGVFVEGWAVYAEELLLDRVLVACVGLRHCISRKLTIPEQLSERTTRSFVTIGRFRKSYTTTRTHNSREGRDDLVSRVQIGRAHV